MNLYDYGIWYRITIYSRGRCRATSWHKDGPSEEDARKLLSTVKAPDARTLAYIIDRVKGGKLVIEQPRQKPRYFNET